MLTKFDEIGQLIGNSYHQVRGKLGGIKADKYFTGTSGDGHPWSLQNGWLNSTEDESSAKIKFDNHPEMSEFNGEEVIITGFTNKDGNEAGIVVQDQGKYGVAIVVKKGCKIVVASHVEESTPESAPDPEAEYHRIDNRPGVSPPAPNEYHQGPKSLPDPPRHLTMTEIRYRETKQIVQYEPVTLEAVAAVDNETDLDEGYAYLRRVVREQLAQMRDA